MTDQDQTSELAKLEARLDAAMAHDSGETLSPDEVDRLFALRRAATRPAKPDADQKPIHGAQRIARALAEQRRADRG